MKKYGCIGKKLTHSFSKDVHSKLADYKYELIELKEEQIAPFFEKKDFQAINVTIPYKQTVIPYLDVVSDIATRIGAVNTIINKNGKLYGYNTDYYGLKALIEKADLYLSGKKVLILGSGGTSKTARIVASDLGAADILTVSRNDKQNCITYNDATKNHADAQIIINTTPSGMYPNCAETCIDISLFPKLEGVVDVVYNPLCTRLVLDAKKRGLKATGGLYMLVMQAVVAAEKFLDTTISKQKADEVYTQILASKQNIVLIGMPGSGKSTTGKLIDIEGFKFIDTDLEIEKKCGISTKELINTKGEKYFRDIETEVIREVSLQNACIISTGGGAILRQENVDFLKLNGLLFFIDAPFERLKALSDRPLSDTDQKLFDMYHQRMPIYKAIADQTLPYMDTPQMQAQFIKQKRLENIQ